MFFDGVPPSKNQQIFHPILDAAGVTLWMKREDQLDAEVSGNKFRKLKYNLLAAKKQGYTTLLTFGGAYSNHIAATAAAGRRMGFQTIGVIRGEELGKDTAQTCKDNATLGFAASQGMQFKFVSRAAYRNKMDAEYRSALQSEFGNFYLIPEGGSNSLAVQGCQEILVDQDKEFDIIACAVGTGGTIAGLIESSNSTQTVLGFSALKGDFLRKEIQHYTHKDNWELIQDYHFGGYGKVDDTLVSFINTFTKEQQIQLDPIYTGKMIFGLFDRIQYGAFSKNTRILAIHTGGLQGIIGINKRLQQKQLPLISV